jgi:lipopolysaccharide transport system permease protein
MSTETVIRPTRRWVPLSMHELWHYRELFTMLVWRDIKVRYAQTAVGIAWVLVQPVVTMAVFTMVFGRFAGMPSDGVPYPLFVYCALLPWQLFAHALIQSSNSVVANERLITKIYFPRLVIPFASVASGLVDFGVASTILVAMLLYYGIVPSAAVLTLPLFVLLAVMTALGVGLWLSALNVRYRDVRHTMPFLTQLWLFVTPVAYPSSLVPEAWRPLYGLNPMAGVTEGFRWALLGRTEPPFALLAVSTVAVVLFLVGGLYFFKSVENRFADVV